MNKRFVKKAFEPSITVPPLSFTFDQFFKGVTIEEGRVMVDVDAHVQKLVRVKNAWLHSSRKRQVRRTRCLLYSVV